MLGGENYGIDVPGLPRRALLRTGARLLYQDYPDEYRAFPPDIELLSSLARATGGKVAPSIAEVFAQQGDEGIRETASARLID